jgi:hypothetical protein
MPPNETVPKGSLLQFVLEWQIDGALDGSTLAPGIETENNVIVQQPSGPDNPYVVEVPSAAGLFNPDGSGNRGAIADRYLQWIRVVPAVFPASMSIDIVTTSLPEGAVEVIDNLQVGGVSSPAFYQAEFDFVPQGGLVRISGLAAPPPGSVHIVQMGVRAAMTADGDAELSQSSCCLSGDAPVEPQQIFIN